MYFQQGQQSEKLCWLFIMRLHARAFLNRGDCMAEVSSIKELEALLKKKINSVLQTDVANLVKKKEQQHAYEDVYGAYTSLSRCVMRYRRRGEGGGIVDMSNMKVYPGDMQVEISNETHFNPAFGAHTECCRPFIGPENHGNELALLIEQGDGGGGYIYNYPFPNGFGDFTPPRPFIQNTREELKNTPDLRKCIVNGLRLLGVDAN